MPNNTISSAFKSRFVRCVTAAIGIVTLSMSDSDAEAQTYKWVAGVQLANVEPAAGGWVWVRLKSGAINCAEVGGPAGNTHLQLKTQSPVAFNNDSFDRIYGTLLTAIAANQNMDIRVTGSSDGLWCIIERVRILAH